MLKGEKAARKALMHEKSPEKRWIYDIYCKKNKNYS